MFIGLICECLSVSLIRTILLCVICLRKYVLDSVTENLLTKFVAHPYSIFFQWISGCDMDDISLE